MKKLLIITDMYPDEMNPVSGIFVKQQVEELANHYELMVIATSAHFAAQFQTSIRHEKSYDVHHLNSPLNNFSFFLSIFSYFRDVIPEIRKIINEWKPDMIHVHDCRHIPELFCLRNELDKMKVKSYLTVHNIKSHPRIVTNYFSRQLYRLTMVKAYSNWTHVFTVNHKLKQDIQPYINANKITVIGNGIPELIPMESSIIEDLRNQLRPSSYKIISVGNLIKEKGFDLIIEAVKTLNQDDHDIQLVILGGGPEHNNLGQLIELDNLENNVLLMPRQINEIVRNLYPLFDAFVLPSYSETFGIVYLEAMYAGLPVIGVQGQGIDGTVIHGENGLLVKPQDVEDLVEKIDYLIKTPSKASEMAKAGQKLVKEKHLLNKIVEGIISIYEH
jgi:teichuronic acid biosynthesis glycosyltransferase TuaC